MRPSDTLSGLPPQFETRSESEKWQGAFKQAQGIVREQGEVMSATLTNNRSLWETNKKLRADIKTALAAAAKMESERNALQRWIDAIPKDILPSALLQQENESLKKANATLVQQLTASMYPELDTDKRRAELQRVKAQEAELQASGLVPTAEDIARQDHARDAQGDAFKFDPVQVRPTGA